MPLQQVSRFYISLESACCFVVALLCKKESHDGFVLPVEREL